MHIKVFERNDVICKSQHGFTKDRSCLTNLLEFFEDVYDWVGKEKDIYVDVTYLDFAKAFDNVPKIRKKAHCMWNKWSTFKMACNLVKQ